MLTVGDFVDFDAGNGVDRYEIIGLFDDYVQLSNCYGATTQVSLEELKGS